MSFRLRRVRTALATVAIIATLFAMFAVATPRSAGGLSNGVLFGAFAQARGPESSRSAVEALERDLGTTLPIVRSFNRFDAQLDNDFHRWLTRADRVVLASVSTRLSNGSRLTWRQIADAEPGSPIAETLRNLAESANRLDGELWLIFNHEPETTENRILGTNEDFKDAWRRIHAEFVDRGAEDVRWVWTMTSWSFEVERFDPSDPRRAERWYPGDDYVDFLGADPYNWNQCRGNLAERWEPLVETVRPFLEWSRRHPGKSLVLPEFGSVEGAPGAKATWLREVRSLMKQGEWKDRFAAIVYFHDNHDDTVGGTSCRWWLDTSSTSLDAARELARDPFFGTTELPQSTLLCGGEEVTLTGSAGPDVLIGTNRRDVIHGLGGNDRISGLDGNDLICGGDGNDRLMGDDGDDSLYGNDGRDVLQGGSGVDFLNGGRHRDRLSGGAGNDRLRGGSAGDSLNGNSGNDELLGGHGADFLSGNRGADFLSGGSRFDDCSGGPGDDRIVADCEHQH